jgi:hypothetical protein
MKRCIGNHFEDDWDTQPAADPDAEYFRECGWCGIQIDLCIDCRGRIFLCNRCFRAQKVFGKDEAKKIGARRERRRMLARRRRLRRSA